jgi:hypothetical protein
MPDFLICHAVSQFLLSSPPRSRRCVSGPGASSLPCSVENPSFDCLVPRDRSSSHLVQHARTMACSDLAQTKLRNGLEEEEKSLCINWASSRLNQGPSEVFCEMDDGKQDFMYSNLIQIGRIGRRCPVTASIPRCTSETLTWLLGSASSPWLNPLSAILEVSICGLIVFMMAVGSIEPAFSGRARPPSCQRAMSPPEGYLASSCISASSTIQSVVSPLSKFHGLRI